MMAARRSSTSAGRASKAASTRRLRRIESADLQRRSMQTATPAAARHGRRPGTRTCTPQARTSPDLRFTRHVVSGRVPELAVHRRQQPLGHLQLSVRRCERRRHSRSARRQHGHAVLRWLLRDGRAADERVPAATSSSRTSTAARISRISYCDGCTQPRAVGRDRARRRIDRRRRAAHDHVHRDEQRRSRRRRFARPTTGISTATATSAMPAASPRSVSTRTKAAIASPCASPMRPARATCRACSSRSSARSARPMSASRSTMARRSRSPASMLTYTLVVTNHGDNARRPAKPSRARYRRC